MIKYKIVDRKKEIPANLEFNKFTNSLVISFLGNKYTFKNVFLNIFVLIYKLCKKE